LSSQSGWASGSIPDHKGWRAEPTPTGTGPTSELGLFQARLLHASVKTLHADKPNQQGPAREEYPLVSVQVSAGVGQLVDDVEDLIDHLALSLCWDHKGFAPSESPPAEPVASIVNRSKR